MECPPTIPPDINLVTHHWKICVWEWQVKKKIIGKTIETAASSVKADIGETLIKPMYERMMIIAG